jgi:hypothetical protein
VTPEPEQVAVTIAERALAKQYPSFVPKYILPDGPSPAAPSAGGLDVRLSYRSPSETVR